MSEQLYGNKQETVQIGGFRLEHDSLGQRDISNQVYYGVQTRRAMENFQISGVPLSNFEHFIDALALVKKAAALANHELSVLTAPKMKAICNACDEILAGKLHEHFVVDMFQGGAGTSTNMNANEVIANRGLELLGHDKGDYGYLHPNDHVNCSQSTNDVYPTAIKLAVILSLKDLLAAMGELRKALAQKAVEFSRAENGPNGKPGCRPDDPRPGIRRLRRMIESASRRCSARPWNCMTSTWAPLLSGPGSTAHLATPNGLPCCWPR